MKAKPSQIHVNGVTVIMAGVVLVAVIAAGVALAFAGWDAVQIIGLLGALVGVATPLLALLDRVVSVHRENIEQSQTLDVLDRRTNGELDARITQGAQSAAEAAAEAVLKRFMNGDTLTIPSMPVSVSDVPAVSTPDVSPE